MAKNFRVSARELGSHSLALQLFGDFDATSACELINIIDDSIKTSSDVSIDTDGLRTINVFGLDVFLPQMSKLKNIRANIKVTGRFCNLFREA